MYPMVNEQMMASAVELVCIMTTAIAAMVTYLLSLRF